MGYEYLLQTAGSAVNDNNWHHVAGTYDQNGGSNNLKIYVDGELETQSTKSGSYTPGNLRIGSNSVGSGEFFIGIIDELSMWNRVFTQEEIQNGMGTQFSPSEN